MFAELSLFPATPEQVIESRRRTWKQWGAGLSEEEYLYRDAVNDLHEIAREGKLITWVLAPRNNPQTTNFLCSCETFRRVGLAVRASLDAKSEPPVEEVTCYGIASVFTPPSNRKRGYARHMMQLLHWVLAPESFSSEKFPEEWGAPPENVENAGKAAFSVLYSDISNFYYTCGPTLNDEGWTIREPISTIFDVVEYTTRHTEAVPEEVNQQWYWLNDKDVLPLWNVDAGKIKSEIGIMSNGTPSFTFLPNQGVAEFQHLRQQPFWEKMVLRPQHWGISSSAPGDTNVTTFATWTLEVRPPTPKTLIITRIRASKTEFSRLLSKIMEHAARSGMQKVEIWNTPKDLEPTATRLGAKIFEREEHLPAFKWYGKDDLFNVQWLLNEKSVIELLNATYF
ncbi:hypothetical protein BDQ12DRAFT_698070 [Crucibulum laeve]|uniref:LYC1 C-terminal domain-containing protein n=1 Tax=Crucibulum laeve TaxID=68775 RepID=A0A5C3M4R2_9AGAR|nr:hypothetical protein BDQ12DRAFT_698070 [Crucibulum laeve]